VRVEPVNTPYTAPNSFIAGYMPSNEVNAVSTLQDARATGRCVELENAFAVACPLGQPNQAGGQKHLGIMLPLTPWQPTSGCSYWVHPTEWIIVNGTMRSNVEGAIEQTTIKILEANTGLSLVDKGPGGTPFRR